MWFDISWCCCGSELLYANLIGKTHLFLKRILIHMLQVPCEVVLLATQEATCQCYWHKVLQNYIHSVHNCVLTSRLK